jgi:DNA-binding transcriptional LysR family regulator
MQILRAVVSSGSVTAAAAHLGYTPSAVSQQVAVLEKEAGIALLERVGRGVRPTAAGRLLTQYTALISQNLAEAETALADLRAGRTGRLAIRYFASVGPALVAPALTRLRREHPGVQIDLKLIEPENPLSEVERSQADLAIVVGPRDSRRQGVHMVHLLDDDYLVALPAGHPLAVQSVVDFADLADEPWVGSEPPGPCLDLMLEACAAAGFSPNFVAKSEDYATAQGFVAAGLGVALIPRLGVTDRRGSIELRQVRRPEPVRSIHAAVREGSSAQSALSTLLKALEEAAQQPAQAFSTRP